MKIKLKRKFKLNYGRFKCMSIILFHVIEVTIKAHRGFYKIEHKIEAS